MTDELRRIFKQQEELDRLMNPYGEISRHLTRQVDPYGSAGVAFSAAESMRLADESRMLALGLGGAASALQIAEEFDFQRKIMETRRVEAQAFGIYDSHSNIHDSIGALTAAKAAYDLAFRLPQSVELDYLAHDALASSSLARAIFGSEDVLRIAMAGIDDPWVRAGKSETSGRAI